MALAAREEGSLSMAKAKSTAQRKAQVAARSAHVQKQAAAKSGSHAPAAKSGSHPTATQVHKKQTATRKVVETPPEPTPTGAVARVKSAATKVAKPVASAATKPSSSKIVPKSGKLNAGDKAPAFNGNTATGEKYSLRQALSVKGNKGAVVFFYPKAGSPGCTTEACDFRDSEATLEAAGYSVVGVSPDTPEQLKSFAAKQNLPFTLVSDPDHKIAAKFGVWDDGHRLGVKMLGQKARTRRSTFVIDPKGKLVYAKYDVQAKDHVKRLKEALGLS